MYLCLWLLRALSGQHDNKTTKKKARFILWENKNHIFVLNAWCPRLDAHYIPNKISSSSSFASYFAFFLSRLTQSRYLWRKRESFIIKIFPLCEDDALSGMGEDIDDRSRGDLTSHAVLTCQPLIHILLGFPCRFMTNRRRWDFQCPRLMIIQITSFFRFLYTRTIHYHR